MTDQLGRVIGQVVQKAPAPVSIARQDLAYLGNDDPSSLTQWLGSSSQELGFTFDHRHQLTNVASSTPGYFSATYDFGPAGRFTHAGEQTLSPQPTGSDVMPREVTYVYGGQDPEQVTQLVNVTDGNTYASFTYDAAGNQQSRCLGAVVTPSCSGESLEYIYDGKDQLRRVTKKLGGAVQGSEEYWYDSFGSRIAIVSRDAAANKTELVTFTNGTESHYNPGGSLSYAYSHVSFGTPVARVKRSAAMITSVEYQFHGLANSTLAAVAADGTINASFSYAPFGSVVESTNNGGVSGNGVDAHKRRHNDKFIDTISELSHYGARYYDKTLLGWTQSDPRYRLSPDLQKSSPRKANLYSFSLQNPLRYLDPDGKDPQNSQAYMIRVRDAVEDGSYEPMKELVRTAAVKTTMGGGKLRALADILRMSVGVNDYRGNEISKDPRGASNLIMVDLNSEDSRKTAEAIGGPFAKANVESLLNHKEYFASATIGGNTIVLSLDRLKDAIERLAIKDPTWNADTKSGRERILEYLDERIAHEVGHNFGLGRGNDDDDDVMKERRTLSDSLMSKRASWSGRDIGGVSDRLDAYRAPRAD
jgi:RHS repeat-associated protein